MQLSGYGRSDWSTKLIRGLIAKAAAGFQSRRGRRHESAPVTPHICCFPDIQGGASSSRCSAARRPWPLAARAQLRKVYRIGVLETTSVTLNAANIAAFHQGMRERGYQEGRDYEIEYRFGSGDAGRYPALAAELVGRHIDLIVTRGTPAVLAAKNATTTIPIVMAAIGDAFEAVSSLAHPGGNVTGLSAFVTELEAKRLELLTETIPGLTRVAHLANMSNPLSACSALRSRGPLQALRFFPSSSTCARLTTLRPRLRPPAASGPRQ